MVWFTKIQTRFLWVWTRLCTWLECTRLCTWLEPVTLALPAGERDNSYPKEASLGIMGVQNTGPPDNPWKSQHYSIEGFINQVPLINWVPLMPTVTYRTADGRTLKILETKIFLFSLAPDLKPSWNHINKKNQSLKIKLEDIMIFFGKLPYIECLQFLSLLERKMKTSKLWSIHISILKFYFQTRAKQRCDW